MYSEQTLFLDVGAVDTSAKNYVNLVGSTGVVGEFAVVRRAQVKRLAVWVKVQTLTGTANPVVTFRLRPTFGSATNEVVLGTVTVPSASAIGKIIYKDIQPVAIPAGYTVAYDLTTAGTDGGTAAGTALAFVDLVPIPEYKLNESNMVASA